VRGLFIRPIFIWFFPKKYQNIDIALGGMAKLEATPNIAMLVFSISNKF
jgi:hypothetical protein